MEYLYVFDEHKKDKLIENGFKYLGEDYIEKEGVCRYAEQRLSELLDFGYKEVVDILRGDNKRGFLFADALHSVSDIFDSCHI